jgi:hypothetical protein
MEKIDRDFVAILNVLSLLREKPMSYEELLKSRFFKTRGQLDFALRRLTHSCCVEKIKAVGIYVILGHGITLLSFYPSWRPLHPEILDIAVPIGDLSEDSERSRCRDRYYPHHNKEG